VHTTEVLVPLFFFWFWPIPTNSALLFQYELHNIYVVLIYIYICNYTSSLKQYCWFSNEFGYYSCVTIFPSLA